MGVSLLTSLLLLSGCSGTSENAIDSDTGMAKFFCGAVKPEAEQANSDFWTLAKAVSGEKVRDKVPSAQDVMDSMLQVSSSAALAAKLSLDPAQAWLKELSSGALDVVRWFGNGDESTEDLIYAVGRWNAAYDELAFYCE
jgi:hypothetical protein